MSAQRPPTGEERDNAVARVLWQVLALNLAVAAVKLVVGFLAGSLTVVSDGCHSVLDGMSNIIALLGVRISRRPPDASHPYGHRKFEALASIAIAAILLLTAWEIGGRVVERMLEGTRPVAASPAALMAILATMAVNLGVTFYERARGRALDSALLSADATHTLSDVFVSSLALLSLGAAFFNIYWLDPIGAAAIAAIILYAAYRIVHEQVLTLTDAARISPEQIREVCTHVRDVIDTHAIRSRGSRNQVWIDLHVVVEADLSAQRVYEIEHEVQDALRERFPQVTQVAVHHQTHPKRPADPQTTPEEPTWTK